MVRSTSRCYLFSGRQRRVRAPGMRFSRVQAVKMLTGRGKSSRKLTETYPILQDLTGVCGDVRRITEDVSDCPWGLSKAGMGGVMS
ncbi:hypothetical protein E2C01_066537 [Portunus trituberculatus]|uniref:Uncharacterized protein n=1 Tax=Portunus trituberculatus TaxID=210409 RepID=A0A5B7HR63_PORTR|nr:hypothetical protein [Portunus trituberculatus]